MKSIKIVKFNKLKRRLKREIDQSIEIKNWGKAKNLCKRLDRVKNSMM